MPQQQAPRTISITVSAGEGESTMDFGGMIIGYGITPPSQMASYDIEFEDETGVGVSGRTSLVGNNTIKEEFQLYRSGTVAVSNATVDGTYNVRLWFKT